MRWWGLRVVGRTLLKVSEVKAARPTYAIVALTADHLELLAEGLEKLRRTQQGLVDADGRAKLAAVTRLEKRMLKRRALMRYD